jgi:outer membrane protein OmpA-like peptidoglycan-associated protein
MKFLLALFAFVWISLAGFSQRLSNSAFKLVNSSYDEQSPVISPDGKILFLTVAFHPDNVGGKRDPGDIWVSVWVGGSWTAPVHGGPQLNNEAYNAVLGFSRDGNRLYLSGHYVKNGLPTTQGISFSLKSEFGWMFPENISIPYFINKSTMPSALTGAINLDENIFIFSAESYSTRGAEDIYISLKREGRWSEPVNLGNSINTSLQEFSPSLSDDCKTIFFSSNGRKGYGSFDIYTSTRLDDSWTAWSTPLNMEQPVNSDAREWFFRPIQKRKTSLFTSTRDSDKYGNIYTWGDSLETPLATVDTLIKMRELNYDQQLLKNKTVLVSGRVTNLKTGAGLSATVDLKSDSLYKTVSNNEGFFKIYVPSTKVYSIEVKAKNFVNLSERLDIHTFELKTLEMNFKLQPIEVGAVVNLKSVLFYMGTTALLEESYPELNAIVDFLKNNPKVEIQLEGHTDNRGDAKKNLILSQQRVDRIRNYLVSNGIGARRIKGKGFGGSKPIATNDSEEVRKLNRRVEFVIIKD